MKIAYLIQCHQKPEMINHLIERLGKDCDIYIHVDLNSEIIDQIFPKENLFFVDVRFPVRWGHISQVWATLELMKMASKVEYNYIFLLSGQDYPIKSNDQIKTFLQENEGKEFIEIESLPRDNWRFEGGIGRVKYYWPNSLISRRDLVGRVIRNTFLLSLGRFFSKDISRLGNLYGGSQWFTISGKLSTYILNYLSTNPEYLDLYRNSGCADELFFQTLIMNSPYKEMVVNDNLRYIKWSKGSSSPDVLMETDFKDIFASGKLFMRKIDDQKSQSLINLFS